MFLDLSFVAEELYGGGGEEGDNLRAGRTARVGAKAGRVVRVIRLVRILKLYKAYYEAQQRKKEREKNGPSEEDDWDDFEEDPSKEGQQMNKESRVGQKLNEITIRRVIILVLTMLIVFPFLTPVVADQHATSAFYGADHVFQTFRSYVDQLCGNTSAQIQSCSLQTASIADTNRAARSRRAYENAFLKYFFFHNWYAQFGDNCPSGETCANRYYAHLFWIGMAGKTEDQVQRLGEMARIDRTALDSWLAEQQTDSIYSYGTMPIEGLEMLTAVWNIAECDTKTWQRLGMSLLRDETSTEVNYAVRCPDDLRSGERKRIFARLITESQFDDFHIDFYFDLRAYSKQDATMNLSTTGFICFVLCVAAMSFATDANHLVLTPVENMIKRVEEIRENPLIAMKMADEEFKIEEINKAKAKRAGGRARLHKFVSDVFDCSICKRSVSEPMETVILEKTIIKLGSLLALGFGEAGANIIGANMRGADSAGVNAMIPGHRVNCILGNVKIRNFSTATEVLQQSIMTFVNQIAEIVHGVVDEYYGAANKNNGDQFLIVWRLEDLTEEETERLAEMAVVAFSLIIGGLHRSPVLAEYRVHPGLQQRLGSDCRVNLSFGLHCGWAIEGAVGSEFKIDASYLSPNVSIVKTIEKVTMVYGVPFLISELVYNLLSDAMASKLRLIDKVVIIGSPVPMTIHSVDLDVSCLKVDRSEPLPFAWTSQRRFRARQFLESEKVQKWNRQIEIVSYFDKDRNIHSMRRRYTEEFFQHFNMGYQNYCQGEWAVARRMLAGTQTMLGDEDGPSSALLRFMEAYQFERPKDWQGVRVLDAEVGAGQ